jgi:putative membrane protein
MTLALTWPPEAYLWFKTLHIVGVVVWFAGLFYLVRLFIYHREAEDLEPGLKQAFQQQYGLMERRLANIITTPGMVVAVGCAVGLLSVNPAWLQQGWMHAKLAFVLALLVYHWFCYRLMGQLQQGLCRWSGRQLRFSFMRAGAACAMNSRTPLTGSGHDGAAQPPAGACAAGGHPQLLPNPAQFSLPHRVQ